MRIAHNGLGFIFFFFEVFEERGSTGIGCKSSAVFILRFGIRTKKFLRM